MLVEKAETLVKPGTEAAFQTMMIEQALPLLSSLPGVKWIKFGRGVENPRKFISITEWTSLEEHAAFLQDPRQPEFIKLFGPFVESGSMEHFEIS